MAQSLRRAIQSAIETLFVDRLQQIIDCANFERVDSVFIERGRKDDERHVLRADLANDVEAIELRHLYVEKDYFRLKLAYRAHCIRFWRQTLREGERRLFTTYLKGLDYNPADEELMANETQALLMHTPDSRAFNAASLGVGESTLTQWRNRFRAGEAAGQVKR